MFDQPRSETLVPPPVPCMFPTLSDRSVPQEAGAVLITRLIARCEVQGLPRPDAGSKSALPKWRLRKVVDYVDTHLSNRITLADMATTAGLTRMHFAAQFRRATGVRPHEYVLRRRIERAQWLLRQSNQTLVDIALSVGFQTQAHFTTVFKRFSGQTPLRWRQAGSMIVHLAA